MAKGRQIGEGDLYHLYVICSLPVVHLGRSGGNTLGPGHRVHCGAVAWEKAEVPSTGLEGVGHKVELKQKNTVDVRVWGRTTGELMWDTISSSKLCLQPVHSPGVGDPCKLLGPDWCGSVGWPHPANQKVSSFEAGKDTGIRAACHYQTQ